MEKVKVEELKHHPRNLEIYERSDIPSLKENIEKLGLLEPLCITTDNLILSGSRRFQCIKELGWNEVEVNRVQINDEDVDYLIFSFNKSRVKLLRETLREIDLLKKHYGVGSGKRDHIESKGPIDCRDIVSRELGVSKGQLDRIVQIGRVPQLVDLVDKEGYSINFVFNLLKESQEKVISNSIIKDTSKEVKNNVSSIGDVSVKDKVLDDVKFTKEDYMMECIEWMIRRLKYFKDDIKRGKSDHICEIKEINEFNKELLEKAIEQINFTLPGSQKFIMNTIKEKIDQEFDFENAGFSNFRSLQIENI